MTTNKPTVIAWAPSLDLANLPLNGGGRNGVGCILTDGPTPRGNDVAMVLLSDYEALQAECADMERDYLAIIEAQDAEHRKQTVKLQAECEKLRKDAETERAIQRAAEVLPPGLSIEIEIEKDAGIVSLFGPGSRVSCDFQGSLAEQINDAIDAAIQGDQP